MNFRLVLNQLGLLVLVLSVIMLGLAGFSWFEWVYSPAAVGEEQALEALLAASGAGLVIGLGLVGLTRRNASKHLGRREAMLLVALSWFLGATLAGAPYWAWAEFAELPDHPFQSPTNCFFEAMSGLTTTGATILTEIGTVPRSLLMWRAITHWLGGLGIVVLFVAVLPSLGVGGKKLFRVEAPGPETGGVRPHIRETARVLWYIYAGITLSGVAAYMIAGMSMFDAFCHAFSVISTGGLSTRDASIGSYDSISIDVVTIIYMLIAGANFALYYQITQRRFAPALRDVELRVYLGLKIVFSILVAAVLVGRPIMTTTGHLIESASVGDALRHGAFTTVALQTGTGFATADYDLWPYAAQALLLVLYFVGGCAGSTAGGVKVIRFWIAAKVLLAELERAFRPQVVRPVRVGGSTVSPQMQLSAVMYIVLFLLLFVLGAVAVQLVEPEGGGCDVPTAASASLTCICNVGPGVAGVGPTRNYDWMSAPAKVILAVLMALGRLEIFAIAVLFAPRYWRRT